MAIRLNPYLSFDGDARAALQLYKDVFGGELTLSTFGELGGMEGDKGNEIMHGMLVSEDGLAIMAADTPPGETHDRGNDFAVSLSGEKADGDQLRAYWEKLSQGGTVFVPLEVQMWGDLFGMCADAYGVRWMVNIGQ